NDPERDKPYRLLLLCQNRAGYLRLCKLLSRAYRDNQYRGRAEVAKSWFRELGTDGLIALSAGRMGDVGHALLSDNAAQAKQLAQGWAALFPGRYYIELHRVGHAEDDGYVPRAVRLAGGLRLPVVAT